MAYLDDNLACRQDGVVRSGSTRPSCVVHRRLRSLHALRRERRSWRQTRWPSFGRGNFSAAMYILAALSIQLGCSSQPVDDGTTAPAEGGSRATTEPTTSGVDYRRRDYPRGPFGYGVGAVLEDLAFLGWRAPATVDYDIEKLEVVRLSEFYSPEGATKLLWINASAVWCSVCRAEMKDIKDKGINATLGAKGLVMIETLFEDNDTNPATPADLKAWGSLPAHSIDYALLLDPSFKLGAFFTSDATPLNMLVDAKTMQVLEITMGYSSDYWQRVEGHLDR